MLFTLNPYDQDLVFKILIAFFVGILIGFDRQKSHKPAGIRTQMLICVGSTLLSGISIHIADMYSVPGLPRPDPARLMAQIITGIGFLGAGVIIKGNHRISGVTTAATIWATAAIGIAIGAGFFLVAIITTLLVLLLSPIGYIQYRLGLKAYTYVFKVADEQWPLVSIVLEQTKLAHRVVNTTESKVHFALHSSEEKKKDFIEKLNKDHIHFEIFDAED